MNTIEDVRTCRKCGEKTRHTKNVHSPVADLILLVLTVGIWLIAMIGRPPQYWKCSKCGTRWDALLVGARKLAGTLAVLVCVLGLASCSTERGLIGELFGDGQQTGFDVIQSIPGTTWDGELIYVNGRLINVR